MKYEFVSEDAQGVAQSLDALLQQEHAKVHQNGGAWDGAPYRTTLHVQDSEITKLYEIQGQIHMSERFRNFAQWLAAQRHCSELYLVVSHEAQTTANLLSELRKNGIGLLVLQENGKFDEAFAPRNPAWVVTPEPSLKYGPLKPDVSRCVEKFNCGQRKDGLRDMCELVERETERALSKAIRKGWCTITAAAFSTMDWANQINALASANTMIAGKSPLIDDKLKGDLHSFRGARNLLDHKTRTKREDIRRQRQFSERMMMGPRLVAELLSAQRKIR